jgi:hypothetical protein
MVKLYYGTTCPFHGKKTWLSNQVSAQGQKGNKYYTSIIFLVRVLMHACTHHGPNQSEEAQLLE